MTARATRPTGAFDEARQRLREPDATARAEAVARHDQLTKPPGSLGELERLGAQLAAIAGVCPPPLPVPAGVAVFAGDHGVVDEGVTPWPQAITARMVGNFLAGGAAINALARQMGATVTVVDVGVASPLPPAAGLVERKVRPGTSNLAVTAAMSAADVRLALDVGAEVAADLAAAGGKALVTGEMGIGNTTAAAALVAAFTGRHPSDVAGRGTGIDDEALARKVAAIERGLARLQSTGTDPGTDPIAVLSEVGGLEHAALAGFVVGGAATRLPVVVDGVNALAALLVVEALAPRALGYCVAGHLSPEPGAGVVLDRLGLRPLLDLGMRLGEGTGACLALPVLEAAARVLREMATFDPSGVPDRHGGTR